MSGAGGDVSSAATEPDVPDDPTDDLPEGVETALECQATEVMTSSNHEAAVPCDHSHFESRILELKKELQQAVKVKDAMVMRYATSENEVIKKSKAIESVEKQLKYQIKEAEALQRKINMLNTERERLAGIIDIKVCEIQSIQKDLEKVREDLANRDFKVKWTQSKLHTEVEAHKVTMARLEKCESDLIEAMAEAERMRSDCRQMIASCSPEPQQLAIPVVLPSSETETSSPSTPEPKDVEKLANNCKISFNSRSPAAEAFLKEIELLKQKHKHLVEENSNLSFKVQNLEQLRHEHEHKISRLQNTSAENLLQIANLKTELVDSESTKAQLLNERDRMTSMTAECQQLRELNAELLADMAICRQKEAELLEYTQQVTVKNVQLQSEFSTLESKSSNAVGESDKLHQRIQDLTTEANRYRLIAEKEKNQLANQIQELEKEIESKDELVKEIQFELDESRGECSVMKKRHETAIKELRKELEVLRKHFKEPSEDGISRASSNTSLNQAEIKSSDSEGIKSDTEPTEIAANLPDQKALVERIVKLQRSLAKKQEKIEFLQEHGKQLLEGLQTKSKIIQTYAMNQIVTSLASDASNHHKYALERQLSTEMMKQGFDITSTEDLTLEVSLELNHKLQACLEDALMKNITMKESMRTLGSEICRLTEANKELTKRVQSQNPSS